MERTYEDKINELDKKFKGNERGDPAQAGLAERKNYCIDKIKI